MRYLIFLTILATMFSCKKEQREERKFSANVDGKSVNFIGRAQVYEDTKDGELFRLYYRVYNLEFPYLLIEVYDSSLVAHDFNYPSCMAEYAYFCDSLGKNRYYNSIDGNFKITKEKDGVLYGVFNFKLINKIDDKDTVKIDNGYFEITLERYGRPM